MANHFDGSSFSRLGFGQFGSDNTMNNQEFHSLSNNLLQNSMNTIAGGQIGQFGLSQRVSAVEIRRTVIAPDRVRVHSVIDYYPSQSQQFINNALNPNEVIVNEVRTTRLLAPSSTMNRLLDPNNCYSYLQNALCQSNFNFQNQQLAPQPQFNQCSFDRFNPWLLNNDAEVAAATTATAPNYSQSYQFTGSTSSEWVLKPEVAAGNYLQNYQHFRGYCTGSSSSELVPKPEIAAGNYSQNYRHCRDYCTGSSSGELVPMPEAPELLNIHVSNDQEGNVIHDELGDHGPVNSAAAGTDRPRNDGMMHSLPHPRYGPYTCPKCKEVFNTSQGFANHAMFHYKSESMEEKVRRLSAKYKPKLRKFYIARHRETGAITWLPRGDQHSSSAWEEVSVRTAADEIPIEGESRTCTDSGNGDRVNSAVVKKEPVE